VLQEICDSRGVWPEFWGTDAKDHKNGCCIPRYVYIR